MNALLAQQLAKHLGDLSDEQRLQLEPFLSSVSDTYNSFENDQKLIQQSLEVSSQEMSEKRGEFEQEAAATKGAIDSIVRSVAELAPETYVQSIKHDNNNQELERLAQFLNTLIREHKKNVLDMVKQKFQTEGLLVELQKFKLAVDNAADYITFCDADFKVIYANKVVLKNPIVGDIFDRGTDPLGLTVDSRSVLNDVVSRVAAGEDAMAYEVTTEPTDGLSPATYQIATTVLRVDEKPQFIINIARDITRERALDKEKDEFVSIASHELRTPMTAIRGFVTVLRSGRFGDLNEQQLEVLEKISRNAKNLIDLVGDMLDLNKLAAGKLDVTITSMPLSHLVNEAKDKFQAMYDEKRIQLEVVNGYDGVVLVDEKHFDRILSNLLSNAYKFTHPDGVVTVSTAKSEDGKWAQVAIVDTGIGIPPAAMDQLFKKFSQVDNVLQRQAGGTGLGLVICKDLVEKMGGAITAKSTYGKGSVFTFTLPI